MKHILFLCTGNTCRSPMAEYCLRATLLEEWQISPSQVEVQSAGLAAWDGEPATPEALTVMKEIGIDMTGHRARRFHAEMGNTANQIYVMTPAHQKALLDTFPMFSGKTAVFAGGINDPIGQPLPVYRRCRNQMEAAARPLAMELHNAIFKVGYDG